jgi:hypothetical protein
LNTTLVLVVAFLAPDNTTRGIPDQTAVQMWKRFSVSPYGTVRWAKVNQLVAGQIVLSIQATSSKVLGSRPDIFIDLANASSHTSS